MAELPDNQPFPLALVSGASQRLGRVLALELGRQGYAIALHYHTSSHEADETAEAIRKTGVPVFPFQADLTDASQIIQLFEKISSLQYPLRVLVNSAALMQRHNLMDISVREWDETLALNLRAPLLCAQQAAKLMREPGGLIVNITDAGASRAWTGFPAYIISKAALENLTRILARTLAPAIRVNSIAPGLILPGDNILPQEWEKLVSRVPARRSGTTEEIAKALVFLLNNEYITGQSIVVDGGYQLT